MDLLIYTHVSTILGSMSRKLVQNSTLVGAIRNLSERFNSKLISEYVFIQVQGVMLSEIFRHGFRCN